MLSFFFLIYFSFIYMCINCLGHFSPLVKCFLIQIHYNLFLGKLSRFKLVKHEFQLSNKDAFLV
jgi:hypothetical protein